MAPLPSCLSADCVSTVVCFQLHLRELGHLVPFSVTDRSLQEFQHVDPTLDLSRILVVQVPNLGRNELVGP